MVHKEVRITDDINISKFSERKNLFICDIPKSLVKPAQRLFKHTESFEEQWDKDLCEFRVDQLEAMLQAMEISSADMSARLFNVLRAYMDWCVEKRLWHTNSNVAMLSYHSIVNKQAMRRDYVASSSDLSNRLKNTEPLEVENGSWVLAALAAMMMFDGIKLEEVADFTEEEMKSYPFSDETLLLRNELRKEPCIYGGRSKDGKIPLNFDGCMLPSWGKKCITMKPNTFYTIVKKIRYSHPDNANDIMCMSPLNLNWSGKFYREYLGITHECEHWSSCDKLQYKIYLELFYPKKIGDE